MDCVFKSNFSLLPRIIQNNFDDENIYEVYENKVQEILVTNLDSKMDEPYILVVFYFMLNLFLSYFYRLVLNGKM